MTLRLCEMSERTQISGLEERVLRVFRDGLNIEVPSADTNLLEEGLLDSLTFVDLLMHLEREFGVKPAIESINLEDFRSVSAITVFLTSQAVS